MRDEDNLSGREPGWQDRWRERFVEERTADFEVAVRFLADRYGNPHKDLIDLIWCEEAECYTDREHKHIHDTRLVAEIGEWMEANNRRVWQEPWGEFHMLKGICGRWMRGSCKVADGLTVTQRSPCNTTADLVRGRMAMDSSFRARWNSLPQEAKGKILESVKVAFDGPSLDDALNAEFPWQRLQAKEAVE
jgi:hypothetical protein